MVAPNGDTRSNGRPAEAKPRQSITKNRPKRSPILRLVGLATVSWFGVFLYTHAVFSKHSVHEHVEQKKEVHPAQQFLQEGKNLRQGVAHVRRMTMKTQATSACNRTVYKSQVQQCIDDLIHLYHMDERISYHFIQLLKDSKEKDLKGQEAEHPCMRINLAAHRASCYEDILATNDLRVAKKMAELLKMRAEDDGISVHDAKIACALAREKDLCLHDVLGTRDLDVADVYDKLPAPKKDEFGKYLLQFHHHKFTEQNAIQSCKMVHPDDRKKCQEHVLKMDDEETAEHYIHLLQDQEHHQEDVQAMTEDQAEALCEKVKLNEYQEQCLEDISNLPNQHLAEHIVQLYDEQQADSLVSQMDAEKLCHHLRLTHHKHKYDNCMKSLTQMKGLQAASHYGKLIQLHKKGDDLDEDPAEKVILTAAKAIRVCEKVTPKPRQEVCQQDVQTMNDWDTAEKYASLLSPPEKRKKEDAGQNDASSQNTFKENAAAACGKSIQEKDRQQCLQGLIRLYRMEQRAALHFIRLLNDNTGQKLKGEDSEHPCERIVLPTYRSTCYEDTLATNDLSVAKKLADLLKQQASGDKVTEHDAKIACALAKRKDLCMYDVLAIGDLDVAETYDQLPLPPKDKLGKFLLQADHHKFTKENAIQACKKKGPEDQKKCQDQMIKMAEKETAEHYIHLNQDQEHHEEAAKVLTEDEAKSMCHIVKGPQKQECLNGIASLANQHMAEHFIELFSEQQAPSLVSQPDAEKLCHHVKLSNPERKLYESCVKSLIQMNGIQAAGHYSKLLKLHKEMVQVEEDQVDKVLLTKAKATSICAKVTPTQRQQECQRDVQTMNDWDVAERYAHLLSPEAAGNGASGNIKKDAEQACQRSIHPDDVPECIDELINLNNMDAQVAKHYIGLLNTSREKNLEGSEAEHPCMKLNADTHRATCYQQVLATNKLDVAKKMAQFLKADEDHKPGVTLHDASIACALAREKGVCIHDVLGTGDLEAAHMYDNHAAPRKDGQGKISLGPHHHHMTDKEAVQACKMVHPDDQEKCQKHVLTMDDEETATHYIHLLQDAEHHLGTSTAVSDSEATSLCDAVKDTKHHQQCLNDVRMLPNQHMAEHIVYLYDKQHASAKVFLMDAQQLCNHLRLSKKQNNHASCVKHLTGVTGTEAAAHFSKLMKQSQALGSERTQTKALLTKAQADSVCGDLKPYELQEECRRDVLTLNDLVTAQHYAQHFSHGGQGQQEDEPDQPNDGSAETKAVNVAQKQAEEACRRSIHPDDVADCIKELRVLHRIDPEVAQHFTQLLMTIKEDNLDGSEAEHPCLAIDLQMQRDACYQDVLATNDLGVAKDIALLMKEKAEKDSMGVTLHDASIACALAIQKALCIHDVMGTMDLEAADAYEKHAAPKKNDEGKLNLQSHHHKFSEKDAEQACRLLHKEDQAKCKQHVLTMDNEDTAEHYIHLLQDEEHHKDTDSTIGLQDAKSLCGAIKNEHHHQQCVQDVSVLPNQHIASHFLPLYEDKQASTEVSQQEAEKLCNHLRLSQKQTVTDQKACIKYLAQTKGIEAASYCSRLLNQSRASQGNEATKKLKKLLTQAQADTVCARVKAGELRQQCKKASLTLNDLDVAQRVADLLDPEAAKKREQEERPGKAKMSPQEDPPKATKSQQEGPPKATKTQQKEPPRHNGMSPRRAQVEKQADAACRNAMHKDEVAECVVEVMKLDVMNPQVSMHYIRLLKESHIHNMGLAQAEHPCLKINSQTHRAACYQDVLAADDLSIALKMGKLMKENEDLEPVEVTLHDAKIACALAQMKGTCIHDVMGTGDLEAAEMYEKVAPPKEDTQGGLALQAHHHKMSEKEAEMACRMVHPDDKQKCQEHVMTLDDEDTAEHYIHLLQDSEHHSNIATTISDADAKALCASIDNKQHQLQCLKDVEMLPNKHLAEHLIILYDKQHATELVKKQDAEKLCNHLRLKNIENSHDACMKYMTKTKGLEAASHAANLLRIVHTKEDAAPMEEEKQKAFLTKEQAESVCGGLKPGKTLNECKRDVKRLTNLDVAQRFVQLLAKA